MSDNQICSLDEHCDKGVCDGGECYKSADKEGSKCNLIIRCPSGMVCIDGRCRKPCSAPSATCVYSAYLKLHYSINNPCKQVSDCPMHHFCDPLEGCIHSGTHRCTAETNGSLSVCSVVSKKLCHLEDCYPVCTSEADCHIVGGGTCELTTSSNEVKVCRLGEIDESFPKWIIFSSVGGGALLLFIMLLSGWVKSIRFFQKREKLLAPYLQARDKYSEFQLGPSYDFSSENLEISLVDSKKKTQTDPYAPLSQVAVRQMAEIGEKKVAESVPQPIEDNFPGYNPMDFEDKKDPDTFFPVSKSDAFS